MENQMRGRDFKKLAQGDSCGWKDSAVNLGNLIPV